MDTYKQELHKVLNIKMQQNEQNKQMGQEQRREENRLMQEYA